MLILPAAVDSVTVSAAEPPTMDSVFETVTVLTKSAEGQGIRARAEVDRDVRGLSTERDRVSAESRRSASLRWRPWPSSGKSPRVRTSLPAPRLIEPLVEDRSDRDRIRSSRRRPASRCSRP